MSAPSRFPSGRKSVPSRHSCAAAPPRSPCPFPRKSCKPTLNPHPFARCSCGRNPASKLPARRPDADAEAGARTGGEPRA
eukprot:350131-Chlamydomonas_euryale.AAC.6